MHRLTIKMRKNSKRNIGETMNPLRSSLPSVSQPIFEGNNLENAIATMKLNKARSKIFSNSNKKTTEETSVRAVRTKKFIDNYRKSVDTIIAIRPGI